MDDDLTPVTCDLCGLETVFATALADGWDPNFMDEETNLWHGPACPECFAKHLRVDEFGQTVRSARDKSGKGR